MGLLSGLVSPPITVLERRLEKIYTQVYRMMGMSSSEARSVFQQVFEWAKTEEARGGDLVVPEGFGNYLIANRNTDPRIGAFLARIAREGIRDKDVLWFWNMHNIERLMMMSKFDWCVGANVLGNLRQGMTQQQAEAHSRKIHPLYGNPDDTSVADGDDRKIPVELKDRIDIYIEKRSKENGDRYDSDMLGASSFNALIRRELHAGRI